MAKIVPYLLGKGLIWICKREIGAQKAPWIGATNCEGL
jgi:hypothetical protein